MTEVRELRGAIARRDAPAAVAALEGGDYSDLLQYAGMAALVVLESDRDRGAPLAESVARQLRSRDCAGDDLLAEELVAAVRGTPLLTKSLPVDLELMATFVEGSDMEPGAYLDVKAGEVLPESSMDEGMVGEDYAIDVDEEPARWIYLPRTGSRAGWRDMATYAARVTDDQLRIRLEDAIAGKGAFGRFKRVVWDAGLGEDWHAFSDDRKIGRARELLHDLGYRARL